MNNKIIRLKHQPLVYIGVFVIFLLMWILAGWNTDNWDWIPYERYFVTQFKGITTTLDFSFILLNEFISEAGFSFMEYRQIIYFLYLFFIVVVSLKYSNHPFIVVSIYFVVMFFRDLILIRNTLALVFLYIGLINLVKNDVRYSKIKFVIFLFIACTFHMSFAIYYVFLLCDCKKIRIIPFFFLCFFMAFIAHEILSSIVSLDYFLGLQKLQEKVDGYLSKGSNISLIICAFTLLLGYVTVFVMTKNIYLPRFNIDRYKKISILMFVILIFTTINMEFIRLYYNLFFINLLILVDLYFYGKKTWDRLGVLIFWILWSFIWTIPLSGVGPQLKIILNSNVLLN